MVTNHCLLYSALSVVLQNWHFCVAKPALLECKTGTFGVQNWQFWNAKLALLECKTGSFGMALFRMWMAEWCYPLIIRHLPRGRIAVPMPYFPPLGKVERDLVFSSSTHWVTEADCNCSLTLRLPYDDAVGSWDLVVVNLFFNLFASYFLETKIMFIFAERVLAIAAFRGVPTKSWDRT